MSAFNHIYRRLFPVIIVGIVMLVTLSGFLFMMSMNDSGSMVHCPMSEIGSWCPSVTNHAALWRILFASNGGVKSFLSILITAFLVSLTTTAIRNLNESPPLLAIWKRQKGASRAYWFSPIAVAFSRGIVHPKIYY